MLPRSSDIPSFDKFTGQGLVLSCSKIFNFHIMALCATSMLLIDSTKLVFKNVYKDESMSTILSLETHKKRIS